MNAATPLREAIWPAGVDEHRGWPMPDGAHDDQCPAGDRQGWLPWAIWQARRDWYVAFYSCDRGHAWTCGHGMVAGLPELVSFRRSPVRILPTDAYLRRHVGEPGNLRLRVIAWPLEVES